MTKITELKQKNDAELKKDLAQLREQSREARFKMHAQELKSNRDIANIRKTIARILTILRERA